MDDKSSSDKTVGKRRSFRRFLLYSVTAFAALVVGSAAYFYFNFFFLFEGNGPAGPPVPTEPFSRVWSSQQVLLLGVGDSITRGFGASKGFSYFERLIENPQQDCNDMLGKNLSAVFPTLKTKNISVSGSDSSHHFSQVQKLEPQPSDLLGIVVMTSGGNDLIHDYGRTPPRECAMYGATREQAKPWIENFKRRLHEMVTGLRKKFPDGCHIFLANIYDPSDGTGSTSSWITGLPAWADGLLLLKAYNEVISQCAEQYDYVHLVDIHKVFLGHGIHCKKFWLKYYCSHDPHYWYSMIIEDPNDRGYDAIRRLFLIEMAKVFFYESTVESPQSNSL
jgi:lysophospholipase L1-like esterase